MNRGGFVFLLPLFLLFLSAFSSPSDSLPTETPTGFPADYPSTVETPVISPAPTETPAGPPVESFTPTAIPSDPIDSASPEPIFSDPPTDTLLMPDFPSPTETPTQTPTITVFETESGSPTQTPSPTATPTFAPPAVLLISEVGWAGTAAASADEWIELWNAGAEAVDLSGWRLTDGGDIQVALSGMIAAGEYFLLERTDDTTISDIAADWIFSGALSNSGESLALIDPAGRPADSVNGGGGWPAGGTAGFASMERMGLSGWCTNDGVHRNGRDAAGNPINGSPHAPFSGYCAVAGGTTPTATRSATRTPTPSPTGPLSITQTITMTPTETGTPAPTATIGSYVPGSVILSEIAWAGTVASSSDEWMELHNTGLDAVDLSGWTLTDGGDIHIPLSGVIDAGGYFLLERSNDQSVADVAAKMVYSGSLANSGERLSLLDPAGRTIDTVNAGGGVWPAGSASPYPASMERRDEGDASGFAWCTNDGIHRNGRDAAGNPVRGTPGSPFSGYCAPIETSTPTPTPTATPADGPFAPFAVVINEIAWAGTAADSGDEWIELWNPGSEPIGLSGWMLTDGGDIHVALAGTIEPNGYFLLEHGEDSAVSDIPAGLVFHGTLSNSGERLQLIDPTGGVVDSAGDAGRAWPAGSAGPMYASMERASIDPPAWGTNTGWVTAGRDAAGNRIHGTPGRSNSLLFPVPTATPHPKSIRINEVLPKPGTDWNGDGQVDSRDEYIELYNIGGAEVDLGGWSLDDALGRGSRPYVFPAGTFIRPGQFLVFFHKQTNLSLSDSGDEVWLLAPDGSVVDGFFYSKTRWPDSAWARLPDGKSILGLGFPPTPGRPNRLPDDLLHPKQTPVFVPAGWYETDCAGRTGPQPVGDGLLVLPGEDSLLAAEHYGWYRTSEGKCYLWTKPHLLDENYDQSTQPADIDSSWNLGLWNEPRFVH